MQFAIINGLRRLPEKNLKGHCPLCGQETLSKCGPKNRWHWAHKGRRHCDPWWENETQWHLDWKNHFPERTREVVQFDPQSGEKHIADIKTEGGVVIELQHSSMPLDELKSREAFYKKMIWIVDAIPFLRNFKISRHPLPDPASPLAQKVRFQGEGDVAGSMFYMVSDMVDRSHGIQLHSARKFMDEILATHKGHYFLEWKKRREVWFHAATHVFFDVGGDDLLWLQRYDDSGRTCVRKIPKKQLIEKYGGSL